MKKLLNNSGDVWGYVSPEWLKNQIRRWGWQTHHIQLRAAIVLAAITANGIGIDLDRREELEQQLQAVAEEHQAGPAAIRLFAWPARFREGTSRRF